MQTLHLRFRDLRAISSGQSPSRWQTPSMRSASTWKGAPPLPNHPKPTWAVGSHPANGCQHLDRPPPGGTGLTRVPPFREPAVCGAVGALNSRQVCWSQTAENNPHPLREPKRPPDVLQEARLPHHKAGQGVGCSLQAPFSEARWAPSNGLSFPLWPQRSGARSSGEKIVARPTDSSGTSRSGATGLRPTGRLAHRLLRKRIYSEPTSSCARTPALVTGQEPLGTCVPGLAQRQRLRPWRGAC